MGLLDELEEYRQPNGLYSNQRNPGNDSSGNCLAITSLALWLAHVLGEFRETRNITRLQEFEDEAKACQVPGYPGLMNRSPTKLGDQNGWDDYVVLLMATGKDSLNMEFPEEALAHSKRHCGTFNNVEPMKFTIQSFLARHPQFLAQLRFSNKERPNILYALSWCAGVVLSSFSKDPTDVVLNFCLMETMAGMSFLCTVAASIWSFANRKTDLQSTVGLWLSVAKDPSGKPLPNMDHPIVKHWRHHA